MLKNLLLIALLSISTFGVEIVVDKTIKKLDFKIEKKSTLKRNDIKEVVNDSTTGLMWQDDDRAKSVKKDWDNAKSYCQNLTHTDYDDWYLPSIKELEVLIDITKYNPAIKQVFKNIISSYYWSSLPSVSDSKYAWDVNFMYGHSYSYSRKNGRYVRCVRAGQ